MKVLTIVGARPQFVKASAVSRELRKQHQEFLVHTGQHYDYGMSQSFFDELEIPAPDVNLGVGSGPHGAQTGAMLAKLEEVMLAERPDRILVYGDTNSTLAGALAASKLHLPVAHVEAGLRSFNRRMPEEVNRVLTDHLADLLFCPSDVAAKNLAAEGITDDVHVVGDVMADVLYWARDKVRGTEAEMWGRLGIEKGKYLAVTVHRAENTDNPERLENIMQALLQAGEPVIFPAHPRTKAALKRIPATNQRITESTNLSLIPPLGYLDMVRLLIGARKLLTDSGGLQKEAYWLATPCITLREETEWVETLEGGWNALAGSDLGRIADALAKEPDRGTRPDVYGTGSCRQLIVDILTNNMKSPDRFDWNEQDPGIDLHLNGGTVLKHGDVKS